MDTEVIPPTNPDPAPPKARIKIFGVGTAGAALLAPMAKGDFPGTQFAVVSTDAAPSGASSVAETIQLETKLLRGLGTGGDPERGRKVAEEHFQKLKDACAGMDVVFIIAGLGGGAGTGITPVLARAAREAGALALAFVTLPFDCEGNRRREQARQGVEQLQAAADGVICLPNQTICKLIDENTSLVDTFRATAQLLVEGVRGVWRLLTHRGLIEIHLDELSRLLRDCQGESCFAAVESAGTTRARDAIEKLPAHPLLAGGEALREADAVLVSIMGGPDLTMADVNRVMERVNQECQRAQVVMGAAVNDAFQDRLAVTLIAMRRSWCGVPKPGPKKLADESAAAEETTPEFDTQLLEKQSTARPASRLVPPPPTLTREQREQLLSKQAGGGRGRRSLPRMKQGNLPLEIVSKGRFDKTEPTVHKGEDLDMPTYLRRGVALN